VSEIENGKCTDERGYVQVLNLETYLDCEHCVNHTDGELPELCKECVESSDGGTRYEFKRE
jgi:hypothetical protein